MTAVADITVNDDRDRWTNTKLVVLVILVCFNFSYPELTLSILNVVNKVFHNKIEAQFSFSNSEIELNI